MRSYAFLDWLQQPIIQSRASTDYDDLQFTFFPDGASVPLLCFLPYFSPLSVHDHKAWEKIQTQNSSPTIAPRAMETAAFIGNLHQLIGALPHRTTRDLAKQYGPVMHL
ncbi:hypothetical protein RJ639_011231 [Escallonia herrerae]|uniref:Uncharacterized protein n=1 Tax=Escallonia herrerae TaxID=1293975 RepID=A0AA88VRP8_9ASTE|nr:hypothetical protein RJ639_011231 [Escallonia herrerae]